jgi:hypothetical protein
MNRNRPNRAWMADSAIDRSRARVRLMLFSATVALVAGIAFFGTLQALFAPLLVALHGIPGSAP